MTKEELLQELRHETWVALKPSPVHGIGVFAIRPIPKGCTTIFSRPSGDWIKLPIREAEQLPAHSRELIETYCLYDETDYYVPAYGFKLMDMVNYINHSPSPNICSVNDGEYFEALTDIPAGAELFADYGTLADVEGY
ncbi:MAG TPA: SET domain-containing protein [Chitinophagaceae bacterium]|nr:SET domain-containing protein [Chitinophagaceae bacterium]